jgi:hypothetical protein
VSLTNKEQTLAVCRRCHPDANAAFTEYIVHASMESPMPSGTDKDASVMWIARVRTAAVAVVALSLVFFFGHSILMLLREFHEKLRRH